MPVVKLNRIHNALICSMTAIVCILAAMFAIDQLCTFTPKKFSGWISLVCIVVLFVAVASYLCYHHSRCTVTDPEQFVQAYNWGHEPNVLDTQASLDASAASYENEQDTDDTQHDGKRVVGPDPTKKELVTWQYNPQNTLVDYKFYEVEPDQKGATPIAVL